MRIRITPGKLKGTVEAVSSKSVLHRQMICAFLSDKPVQISCRGISRDIIATAQCIIALGGNVEIQESAITVAPPKSPPRSGCILNCDESGSTARFMLPVASALTEGFTLTGSGRLPDRPMEALCHAMEEHGCRVSSYRLPMTVSGRLTPGFFRLPGNVTSQYVSGLLLALSRLGGRSDLVVTGPLSSEAYVQITLDVLKSFGVDVRTGDGSFTVFGVPALHAPDSLRAEGDWSNGAFWLCARDLGGDISVTGLRMDSVQGDRMVLPLLERILAGGKAEIDIDPVPDLLPILSVAACGAVGETVFTNAARLRLKESDRISSSRDMVLALGGRAKSASDSLTVYGSGSLRGGTVDGRNDHRIVMSAAIAAGICRESVTILDAQAVEKSYPDFFGDFRKLGGTADVV